MTLDELARLVADDFNKTITNFDYESLEDMAWVSDWSDADLNQEIKDTINIIGDQMFRRGEAYGEDIPSAYQGYVSFGKERHTFRAFKKLFMKYVITDGSRGAVD